MIRRLKEYKDEVITGCVWKNWRLDNHKLYMESRFHWYQKVVFKLVIITKTKAEGFAHKLNSHIHFKHTHTHTTLIAICMQCTLYKTKVQRENARASWTKEINFDYGSGSPHVCKQIPLILCLREGLEFEWEEMGGKGNFQQRKLRKVQGVFEQHFVVIRGVDIAGNKAGKIDWDQIMKNLPG